MTSDDQFKITSDKLIELLRDLLATGNWEASLFLKTTQKKLQKFHAEAIALSEEYSAKKRSSEDEWEFYKKKGYVAVYVSLYQSDPYSLIKWEHTLKSIREYSVNRPIYRSEEHVQAMIRAKQNSPKEGYAAIYVQESDIISPYAGKVVEDKWGHELLTLRDNSLLPGNIIEFVHQSRHYAFKDGKLLLMSENP
jgi:intracellular multiplication protein IcmQ